MSWGKMESLNPKSVTPFDECHLDISYPVSACIVAGTQVADQSEQQRALCLYGDSRHRAQKDGDQFLISLLDMPDESDHDGEVNEDDLDDEYYVCI